MRKPKDRTTYLQSRTDRFIKRVADSGGKVGFAQSDYYSVIGAPHFGHLVDTPIRVESTLHYTLELTWPRCEGFKISFQGSVQEMIRFMRECDFEAQLEKEIENRKIEVMEEVRQRLRLEIDFILQERVP